MAFDNDCSQIRLSLKDHAAEIHGLLVHPDFKLVGAGHDYGEMKANIMLAYRHMEDAIMRLGKAIQAYDGGRIWRG